MRFYGKDADFFNYERDEYVNTLTDLIKSLQDRQLDSESELSNEWLEHTISLAKQLKEALE